MQSKGFNMKRIITLGISTALAGFLLTGCSTKGMIKEHNDYSKEQLKNLSKDKLENASANLRSTEIHQEKKFIDLSVSKKLEDVLAELSKLENKIYMITDDKSNIYVPSTISSKLLKINNLNSLKTYIEDTTNYTLDITKNKYVNNRPKIIKVVDKKALESDFSNLNFQVSSKSTVSAALTELSKKINFSIIYKNDLNSANSSTTTQDIASPDSLDLFSEKYFSDEYVYFTGNNVSDFLNYIEQNFDVYTDINYEDKIISISKYKTKMFNVTALNYNIKLSDAQMSSSTSSTDVSSTDSSTDGSAALQTETEIKGVEIFKANLENFLVEDKLSKLIFNVDSGQIIVKTTNQNMKEIEKIINEYNKKYTTQIQVTVDIYEFVLNKNYNFGTDLKYTGNSSSAGTNFLESNILSAITNIAGGKKDLNVLVDSKNDFIRYAKSYTYTKDLTNNIPDTINVGNNKKYIASSSTTTTSNTSTTSSTDQQIENLNEGVSITLMPRVVGNKIILKNEVKINSTNDLVASTDKDGNTIYMPDQDVKTLPGHVVITSGNKRVIGSYQDFQDVKNYKGAAPIEDFVIAGSSGKSFVKKEIIVVLSAKIL
jgi:hypothetical protein